MSFRHAVELLRADHPSLAAGDGHVVRKGTTAKLACAGRRSMPMISRPCASVMAFYHETLKNRRKRCGIWKSRGLTHPEMIGHFQLGFANRKLG